MKTDKRQTSGRAMGRRVGGWVGEGTDRQTDDRTEIYTNTDNPDVVKQNRLNKDLRTENCQVT